MSTSRPFSYNTGSTITGTEQVGNLAIGTPTNGFSSTGLKWWNGPDEDLGYVVAHQTPSGQPGADGDTAFLGFWRSDSLTDNSFISLANTIGGQTFTTETSAKTWLNDNGYWTSWTGPVTNNLLLFYDAGDTNSYPGSGTTVTDLSSPQYNGTLVGTVSYDLNNGGTFVFPSANTTSYISIGRVLALQPTNQITLEQWLNPDDWTPTGFQSLSCTQGGGYAISLRNNGIDAIFFAGGSYRNTVTTTTGFTGWNHVVASFDGRYTRMYINGNLVDIRDAGSTFTMTYNATNGLFIGAEAGSSATIPDAGQKYEGKIAITRIYNVALSDSEVLQNFNQTRVRFGL